MAIPAGTRIGAYEVLTFIGRGGMGEVYRARDGRLGRDVALKILPDTVVFDTDRLARFEREAKVLAALNHPNIAQVYDFEKHGPQSFLVMELVQGPTLDEVIRTNAGPSLTETLAIARQIALALEVAHERGIIHRDLKPANIKLTAPAPDADASVKVLDFGLAKAMDARTETPDSADAATVTSPALTAIGVILGTAAYMAPEQAKGRPADRRADVWAFGVVLFEMLTKRRPFDGADVTEVLAAVVRDKPPFEWLPPDTPPAVRRLLRRCLEKNPRERLADMGAVRLEIQEAQTESAAGGGAVAGRPARRWWQRGIPWPVVAGMLLVAGAVVVWRFTPAAPASVNRLEMTLPVGDSLARGVALSPNGRTVVYVATRAGVTQLFKRSLGELTATPIPGTAGARSSPLIWPDSDSMTFIVHPGQLKKTRLSGGTPVTLLELRGRQIRGVTIQGRRLILGSHGDGLFQASLEGGTPEPKTSREQASTGPHRDPDAVPGGGVLFRIGAQVTASQIVGLRAGETTWQPIVQGSTPKYLPTGHLMFWRQGSLWVAAFDPATMSLRGDALSVVPNVEIDDGGQATAAWSADGTLAYLPARWGALRSFAIVDARGRETPVSVPPAAYADPVLSPDGTRVLARAAEPAVSSRVFVIDIKPGLAGRLTRDQAVELRYLWAPDSVRVVFSSEGAGLPDLQLTRADRAGTGEPLGIGAASPLGWTADRQGLIYQTPDEAIHVRSLADKTSRQLAPAPPDGLNAARLSPNGRWIAYATGEPGQELVCVRPVPNLTAARFTISAVGGTTPRWHPNGRALFYREGQSIKRISFDPATGPAKGEPVEFVSWPTPGGFDVMSDGRLLLLKNVTPAGAAAPDRVIVIQNWFDEIRRLVPVR